MFRSLETGEIQMDGRFSVATSDIASMALKALTALTRTLRKWWRLTRGPTDPRPTTCAAPGRSGARPTRARATRRCGKGAASLEGAVRAALRYARKPAHKFRRLVSQGEGGELCSCSTAA